MHFPSLIILAALAAFSLTSASAQQTQRKVRRHLPAKNWNKRPNG